MTHRSCLAGFIIDCRTDDLRKAAGFWAAVLGSGMEPEGNPKGDPTYIWLDRQNGLHLEVQAVSHESRVHLDIETDDIPAEVARLERLGASVVAPRGDWVVMQAPTGHRFCVVPAASPDFDRRATVWP